MATSPVPTSSRPALLADFSARALEGRPAPSAVRIRQRGEIRLGRDEPWLKFRAEQTYRADRPQFWWRAIVWMGGVLPVVVEDTFQDGAGVLNARFLGLFRMMHAEGAEVAEAQLQRWLSEVAWNPGALERCATLETEELAPNRVRLRHGEASVDFGVDENGDLTTMEAMRFRDPGQPRVRWVGRLFDYATVGGFRIPTRGEVAWDDEDGEYVYWRGEVTSLEVTA